MRMKKRGKKERKQRGREREKRRQEEKRMLCGKQLVRELKHVTRYQKSQ